MSQSKPSPEHQAALKNLTDNGVTNLDELVAKALQHSAQMKSAPDEQKVWVCRDAHYCVYVKPR